MAAGIAQQSKEALVVTHGHLAFQLTVDPSTAVPFLVGKLVGGIAAVALAMALTRTKSPEAQVERDNP